MRAPAAVYNELRALNPEIVVFGGDLVPGPFPAETVQLAREAPWASLLIRRNGDRNTAAMALRTAQSDEPPELRAANS